MMKEPQTLAEIADYSDFVARMVYLLERISVIEDEYWVDLITPEKNAEYWKMLRDLLDRYFGNSKGLAKLPEKYKKAVLEEYGLLMALVRVGWKECYELKATLPWDVFHSQFIELYRRKMEIYHFIIAKAKEEIRDIDDARYNEL
jgi:hypothetical protein